MADTRRTLSALQSLLADNTSGAISAQDVRDFLVSAAPGYGAMYVSSAAATTIGGAGTYTKALGTTTAGALSEFTMPSNNRLTYGGVAAADALLSAHLTVTSASANQVIGVRFAKNGTTDATTTVRAKVLVGADEIHVSLAWIIGVVATDYIEVFITNETGTNDVTVQNMVVTAQAVLT